MTQMMCESQIEQQQQQQLYSVQFSLLFCHKLYKSKKKTNYLNTNGEETQGKPPGL